MLYSSSHEVGSSPFDTESIIGQLGYPKTCTEEEDTEIWWNWKEKSSAIAADKFIHLFLGGVVNSLFPLSNSWKFNLVSHIFDISI